MLSSNSQVTTEKEKLSSEHGITSFFNCKASMPSQLKSPPVAVQQKWKYSVYSVNYWWSVLISFYARDLNFCKQAPCEAASPPTLTSTPKPVWFYKGNAYSFG